VMVLFMTGFSGRAVVAILQKRMYYFWLQEERTPKTARDFFPTGRASKERLAGTTITTRGEFCAAVIGCVCTA
jgi:hypothetical protein